MTGAEDIALAVKRSGTSFYWAMRLLPQPRRQAMFALYAFCRAVDDIADDFGPSDEKQQRLQDWRVEIAAAFAGQARTDIGRALMGPIRDFSLRRKDFLAIIDGMAMDAAEDIVAPDLATFDLYCDRVASAVGRISVRIFGAQEAAADLVAHHLGRALQMTNILRDLREDGDRHRLYLPRELLIRHGIAAPHTNIAAILADPALPAICGDLANSALAEFAGAERAMRDCAKAPMRPARIMSAFYRAQLDCLIAGKWRDLARPPRLSAGRKLAIVLARFWR